MFDPHLVSSTAPIRDDSQSVQASSLLDGIDDPVAALVLHSRESDGIVRRLAVGGDVGFSARLSQAGSASLAALAPALAATDLSFVNLETPLLEDPGGRLFAAPVVAAAWLAQAGIDVVNVANNHMLDFGAPGLASTLEALEAANLRIVGASHSPQLSVFDLTGLRVGFLAATRTLQPAGQGVCEYDPERLAEAVRAATSECDVVVVSLHLGYMFLDVPHPGQRQEILNLLEAGAHLVLVHHPHVLQGVEVTANGGIACYSLGNLLVDIDEGGILVDQMRHEQSHGAIFFFDLDRLGVARAVLVPTRIVDSKAVAWGDDVGGEGSIDRVRRLSLELIDPTELAETFKAQMAERLADHVLRSASLEFFQTGWRHPLRFLRRVRLRHLGMLLRRLRGQRR